MLPQLKTGWKDDTSPVRSIHFWHRLQQSWWGSGPTTGAAASCFCHFLTTAETTYPLVSQFYTVIWGVISEIWALFLNNFPMIFWTAEILNEWILFWGRGRFSCLESRASIPTNIPSTPGLQIATQRINGKDQSDADFIRMSLPRECGLWNVLSKRNWYSKHLLI